MLKPKKKRYEPGRYYAAPFNAADSHFQKELTRIGGLNPYNEPNLKLEWGMNKRWLRSGRWQPQYPSSVVRHERIIEEPGKLPVVKVEIVRYGTPLWIVERWYPAEVICPQGREYWEMCATFADPDNGGLLTPVLGPYPEHGEWRGLVWIHDGQREYQYPNAQILEQVRNFWFEQQHDTTPVEQQIKNEYAEIEARRNRLMDELGERLDDAIKSTAHWIADPARKRKGGSGTRMIILPGQNPAHN